MRPSALGPVRPTRSRGRSLSLTACTRQSAVGHNTTTGDGRQDLTRSAGPEPEEVEFAEDLDPAESTLAATGPPAGPLPRKRKSVRFSETVHNLVFDSPPDEPARKRAKTLPRVLAPTPPRSPHKPAPAPALHMTGLFAAGLGLKANKSQKNPAHISPTSDLITATSSASFFAPPPPPSKSPVAGPSRQSMAPVLAHDLVYSSSPSPESSPPRETAPPRQSSSSDATSRLKKCATDAGAEGDSLHHPRPSTPITSPFIVGPPKLTANTGLPVASAVAGPSWTLS